MSIISRRYTKIIFKNFNKIIYHKNNLLIRPLKIEDIKENYIKNLQDKTINKYLVSKKKKELTQNHIKQYVSSFYLEGGSWSGVIIHVRIHQPYFTIIVWVIDIKSDRAAINTWS